MKTIQKYLWPMLCTVVLILIAIFALPKAAIPLPIFRVYSQYESITKELSIFDAKDGNYYVFLPSYADMEHVTISITSDHISLDDVILSDGMDCGEFELERPYSLAVNKHQIATLWFYQSSNVATMYIDTATGSMDHIHADKNYEENASITLYAADGKINYDSKETMLKGRGNSTWHYDKRPYSLILSSEADLLGMGSATNWVLLANAADETNLNNYLIYDLASRVGFAWTPECSWVDVYLNGEYNGLYLLTEKVEVGMNRLNIDTAAGDFLCKFDLHERWNTLRNPFLTNTGRTVEISYPEILSQTDAANAAYHVNQMEQIILSGADLSKEPIIDLDSWVRRYLIDEISGNIDSDWASSYFYFLDGIFYAGPVWDYDLSLGNRSYNHESNSFIAKNLKKSQFNPFPYYSALYENESFYNRMIDIYSLEFLPVLQKMVDSEIHDLAIYISDAAQMNSLRWRSMYDMLQSWNPNTVRNPTDLISYLEHRITFLNSAWLENTEYCTIQFKFTPGGTSYWNISIQKGYCLETSYVDIESCVWIDSETGEVFDFSQPIMTDLILTQQISEYTPSTRDYVTFLSIAIFFILFLGLIIIDVAHRQKERRSTNERSRTEVSS